MMEGLRIWIPGVICFAAIGLLLVFQLSLVSAQQGFLSINSRATSNITDTNGIHWTTDDNLFPDTSTCQESTVLAHDIPTFRESMHQPDDGDWPRLPDTATFLRWGSDSSFSVLVGVTKIALVNSSEESAVVEDVFREEGGYEYLCLWRQRGHTSVHIRRMFFYGQ